MLRSKQSGEWKATVVRICRKVRFKAWNEGVRGIEYSNKYVYGAL